MTYSPLRSITIAGLEDLTIERPSVRSSGSPLRPAVAHAQLRSLQAGAGRRALFRQLRAHFGRPEDDPEQLLARTHRALRRGELVMYRSQARIRGVERPVEDVASTSEDWASNEVEEDTDWIEVQLVDSEDQPLAGVAYELELANGVVRRGRTNGDGLLRHDRIPSGTCMISLPQLHGEDWSLA